MQIGLKAVFALSVAGLTLAFCTTSFADSLTVKTEQGKVHGKTINDGKVKAFLGLPYAAPPVGRSALEGTGTAGEVEGGTGGGAVWLALRAGPGV